MKKALPFLALCALSFSVLPLHADQLSVLNTASTYAVLGATTVTNTGPTVLGGDLGLSPGTSITGFPPGTVLGTTHNSDGNAAQAQTDALAAYQFLAGLPITQYLTGQDLGFQLLTPGVYSFASSAQLTGPLTLDFQGLNNANIVFQIGSTLTTASGSVVNIINQGLADNVFFQVGSSATLGTYSTFQGDILANTSVTLTTGANITCGAVMALNGAVTLDTNNVNVCSGGGSDVSPATTPSPVPEPGSIALVATGMLAIAGAFRRGFAA